MSVRRQKGARGKPKLEPFIVVSMGMARKSRVNCLASAGLSKSSRPWHIGAVPSCQVPGPAVRRAEEILLLCVRVR